MEFIAEVSLDTATGRIANLKVWAEDEMDHRRNGGLKHMQVFSMAVEDGNEPWIEARRADQALLTEATKALAALVKVGLTMDQKAAIIRAVPGMKLKGVIQEL